MRCSNQLRRKAQALLTPLADYGERGKQRKGLHISSQANSRGNGKIDEATTA